MLAAVLAVLGFLLVTAASSTRASLRAAEPRKAALISQINDRRSDVADLDQAVRQLRQQVVDAQRAEAERGRADRNKSARDADLAAEAGTVAMRGAALTVKLSDSDRQPSPGSSDAGAYKIHDSDLQLVVNALFEAGAEAVALNDNRVVATTPIRAAGGTIVVNFRPLSPPYRVVGIGADKTRFEQSEIAKRFHRWTSLFGLGFSVSHNKSATVPAYTGRVSMDDAEPAKG